MSQYDEMNLSRKWHCVSHKYDFGVFVNSVATAMRENGISFTMWDENAGNKFGNDIGNGTGDWNYSMGVEVLLHSLLPLVADSDSDGN